MLFSYPVASISNSGTMATFCIILTALSVSQQKVTTGKNIFKRSYDEQCFTKLKLSFWIHNHRILVPTIMEILHKQK